MRKLKKKMGNREKIEKVKKFKTVGERKENGSKGREKE